MSAPAAPAGEATRATVRIEVGLVGARTAVAELCGARRRVFTAGQGEPVAAKLRLKGLRDGGLPAKPRLTLAIERCVAGRWSKPRRAGAAARRPGRLATLPIETGAVGELRLRASTSIARTRVRSAPLYLRIAPSRAPIVDVPVTFKVKNLNRSAVSCSSDGKDYTIAGRLLGPASLAEAGSPAAVTLYLHEFSFGKFFWRFGVPAYDYASAQARAGHASVIVDRLGYDESPGPHGRQVCAGSQADMAHQMVLQLRGGGYAVEGIAPRAFGRVALAGHSIGAMIAEVEAYSFGEIDALVVFAWADQGFSSEALYSATAEQGATCTRGGEPAEPGGPGGYAYTTPTREGFARLVFADAEPAVVERAAEMRNRDPCGDASSQPAAIAANARRIGELTIPILLLYGTDDAIFDQPAAGERQKAAYTGSRDITMHFIERAGHALTLEKSAPRTRALASDWLGQRGF